MLIFKKDKKKREIKEMKSLSNFVERIPFLRALGNIVDWIELFLINTGEFSPFHGATLPSCIADLHTKEFFSKISFLFKRNKQNKTLTPEYVSLPYIEYSFAFVLYLIV